MILCAQCGKKNKDGATVCKHCGYNPGALQMEMPWEYQGGYMPMQYPQPMAQSGPYYYDAEGRAYTMRFTPVDEDYDDEDEETPQMMTYTYNPAQMQAVQRQPLPYNQPKKQEQKNTTAIVAYFLAMFFDILAWPFCILGLWIAGRRDGAKRDLCIGGMLFTLLKVLSAAMLFAVWWGISTYLPQFFATYEPWKGALAKIILFGWPVAIGSIFAELSPEGSGLRAAGRGHFYLFLVVAVLGLIFFDITWLPIFA